MVDGEIKYRPEEVKSREFQSSDIKTIWELDDSEKQDLHQAFIKNQGKGRMVIHPFYFLNVDKFNRKNGDGTKKYQPKFNQENEALVRRILVNSLKNNEHNTPVFILEEEKFVDYTKNQIAEIENLKHLPIIIPSRYDVGIPLIPGHKKRHDVDEKNWSDMDDLLANYGAKEFLISGMYLELNQGRSIVLNEYYKQRKQQASPYGRMDLNLNYYFDRCVGHAVQGLSKRFKIDFSFGNFPHNRKDILEIENSLRNKATDNDIVNKLIATTEE